MICIVKYTINNELNGIEIKFDEKPSEDIRSSLKRNGFRWHKVKKVWYAKNNKERLIYAESISNGELPNEELGGEVSEGYMGGNQWNGNKSNRRLYGSDLSRAIREEFKAQGIKGCTVSVQSYSMGQTITVKVGITDNDFIPFDEWICGKSIYDFQSFNHQIISEIHEREWRGRTLLDYDYVDTQKFYDLSEEEQKRIYDINAKHSWLSERNNTINQYHLETYTTFTEQFMQKLHKINDIINTYRYDESNSMVDYFDTNFYYDIVLKEIA